MKYNVVIKLAVVTGIAAISFSSVKASDQGAYAKLEPGVSFISGSKLKVSGSVNDPAGDLGLGALNLSGNAPANLKYNAGYGINGTVGYRFNDAIALELETGYQTNALDSIAGIGVTGVDLRQWSGFGNVVLSTKFGPSISGSVGGGYGFVNVNADLDVASYSDTVFAGQLKAGLAFEVAEAVSFVLGYRAQFVRSADLIQATAVLPSGGSISGRISTDSFVNHQITAGISIGF